MKGVFKPARHGTKPRNSSCLKNCLTNKHKTKIVDNLRDCFSHLFLFIFSCQLIPQGLFKNSFCVGNCCGMDATWQKSELHSHFLLFELLFITLVCIFICGVPFFSPLAPIKKEYRYPYCFPVYVVSVNMPHTYL